MGEDEDMLISMCERLKEIQAGIDFTQDEIEGTQQSIMQLEDMRVSHLKSLLICQLIIILGGI